MDRASEFAMSPLRIKGLSNGNGIWIYLRDGMELRLDFLDAFQVSLGLLVK
jgi:hypothetical protein